MKMCLWWSKFPFGKHRWSRAANGGLFAALLAVAGVSTQAQTLNLQFSNSSNLYSNDDIWITFTTGQQGYEFTASYGSTVLSNVGTPQGMYWSNSYQYFVPGTSGGTYNSAANLWMSEPIQLSALINAGGLTVTKADSVRAYVSLGSPMTVLPTTTGTNVLYNNSMAVFGQPSISNTADPNYNIRWDLFEIAVTPAVSDQGDVTAINATAIPMRMESFTATSSTPVQTIETSSNYAALLTAAQAYYNANLANNTDPQLPTNPMVMNGTNFLRAMGITNGQQAAAAVASNGSNGFIYTPAGGAGAVATIGVNATFGDYVAYVHQNNVTTPLVNPAVQAYDGTYNYGFNGTTYTTSWNSGQEVSASWQIYDGGNTYWSSGTLTSQVTGGTGAAVVVEGEFIQTLAAPGGSFTTISGGTLGRYKMILPPDYTNPGEGEFANYLQSAILYSGAQASNFGVIFEYTPFDVNSGTFLATSTYLNYNDFVAAAEHFSATIPSQSSFNADTVMSKVVHDLASGYNFGLIGSTVVDPATGTTFNADGSEIWTFVWSALEGGATSVVYNGTTYNASDLGPMPLFEDLQPDNPFYNQWAELIHDSSVTAYGGTYSDYLQSVLVNLLAAPNQTEYNIDHVTLTILDVNTVVPEASAVTLLLVAGAGWMLTRSRKNRKNGISS